MEEKWPIRADSQRETGTWRDREPRTSRTDPLHSRAPGGCQQTPFLKVTSAHLCAVKLNLANFFFFMLIRTQLQVTKTNAKWNLLAKKTIVWVLDMNGWLALERLGPGG